ncbi:DUF397 domain-containing protein [Nocardia sp. NPDC088792]|uniref:DUF397 domain-containing protein n=1 Tax=Nocardia sp. NPDC088792 TaxID=3364332 RepID=UPI0038010CD5
MTIDLSGADWFKSSFSGDKADCIEIAFLADGLVGVRDSKHAGGPALTFAQGVWDAFVDGVARGRLDRIG